MKAIAIIPAKFFSERCPEKNLRRLNGLPLFMLSVLYAQREGVEPVVSTDSEQIMAICEEKRIRYIREVVDDSTMCNCIRQVLAQVPCDMFVLLQPSSPFRRPGLLRRMLRDCMSRRLGSAYTALEVKPIGRLDGHFRRAYRDQDTKDMFLFFDGNIAVVSRSFFGNAGELFDDSSVPYLNNYPCSLQIDTEEDFTLARHLAAHAACQSFLPSSIQKVCLVSNRKWFTRDYSDFVDSCDVVIRVNKMENLDTGLSGRRTDIVVLACWRRYLAHSRAARHMDALIKAPMVFFDPWYDACTKDFCASEGLLQWAFLPPATIRKSKSFSTFGKAIMLADWLFPDAQLFCLADPDVALRTSNCCYHVWSGEAEYISSLLHSGRMTCILEDDLPPSSCRFSRAMPCRRNYAADKALLRFAPMKAPYVEIEIRHPRWSDQMRLLGRVACRVRRPDFAEILYQDSSLLRLKWERHGMEEFERNLQGSFVYKRSIPILK